MSKAEMILYSPASYFLCIIVAQIIKESFFYGIAVIIFEKNVFFNNKMVCKSVLGMYSIFRKKYHIMRRYAMGLSTTEILVIVILVLLLFGAKKIPELARSLGRASYEFKKAKEDIANEVKAAEEEAASEDK